MTISKLMRIIEVSFLLSLLPVCVAANAEPLENLLVTVRTYQADFVQTIHDDKGKIIRELNGHFFLSRPGKFRWETTAPFKEIIVANGSKLKTYDVGLEQVTEQSVDKVLPETPMAILSHSEGLSENFTVEQIGLEQDSKWFRLIPKKLQNQELFNKVELKFVGQSIQEMKIYDKLGQFSWIKFSHIQLNSALANSVFELEIPKGVDIVRQ